MLETCFSVVMAQHETCFAGSVLQGSCVLAWIAAGQLCILRGTISTTRILCSALGQPHCWCQHCWCQRRPNGFPSQAIATFHRFPLGIAQATSFAIGPKNPLATFGATFLERQKLQKFWANFEKIASFGHNQAKFGQFCIFFGLWVAEFCGNSAEAGATRRFLSRKVHFWPRKSKKKADFGRKTYVSEYFGFSAAILQKILKGQNPSPNGPDCIFQRSQRASEVLQALSPLTATNLFFLAAW